MDEKDTVCENSYNEIVTNQFLDGYVDEDAVYDDIKSNLIQNLHVKSTSYQKLLN